MLQKVFSLVRTYERHLSALAMAAGFIADNFFFERIDLLQTQVVFAAYAIVCFIAIPLSHWFEIRASRSGISEGQQRSASRWRLLLPLAIQFALGGFWSGFVIFYGRSANFGASWPFLLFLLFAFLGGEYFRHYHARLVFTSVLFFFALYSYAIFAVPIYTGSIGTLTFLMSGALAIGVFALFTMLLRTLARERFLNDVWRIRAGAFAVLVLLNVFYFTNVLPPLPLSAEVSGIYHGIVRVSSAYLAQSETGQSWQTRYLGFPPTLHIVLGKSLTAYSSVFAPTKLATTIVHRWQRYDPVQKAWLTKSVITYSISGGRDGGYRGYSTVPILEMGEWRVSIETSEGRLLTRLPFTAVLTELTPPMETIVLK